MHTLKALEQLSTWSTYTFNGLSLSLLYSFD
jgi:hypothetical protein